MGRKWKAWCRMTGKFKLRVEVDYDSYVENPFLDWGTPQWMFGSFESRSVFWPAAEKYVGEGCDISIPKDLRERGYLFDVSLYRHSGDVYSLRGEGMQCEWDTVQQAGFIYITGEESEYPESLEERKAQARQHLQMLNDYVNGQVFVIGTEGVKNIPDGWGDAACGGYHGVEHGVPAMAEYVVEHLQANALTLDGVELTAGGGCEDVAADVVEKIKELLQCRPTT